MYEVVSPAGKTYIVEESSGGIVGANMKDVLEDIATESEENIHLSVQKACERAKTAQTVDADVFWSKFR